MTTCQPAELNVPQWNSACWVTICLAPTPLPPHTPPPYLPPPGKRKHSLTPTPLHSASVPHIAEGKHCPSSAQGWSPPAGFSGELVHGGGGWWLVEELSIVSLLISRHDGIPGSCLSLSRIPQQYLMQSVAVALCVNEHGSCSSCIHSAAC